MKSEESCAKLQIVTLRLVHLRQEGKLQRKQIGKAHLQSTANVNELERRIWDAGAAVR